MVARIPTAIYSDNTVRTYTGAQDDLLNIHSAPRFALNNATISLSFSMDRLPGDVALVSRDGHGDGAGDFTLWVKDGSLVVTQSNGSETEWLRAPDLLLSPQQTYQVALSFGEGGLLLWLDGVLVAAEPDFQQGMELNSHDLVIGGTRAWREDQADDAHSLFQGEIGNVQIFDRQLTEGQNLALAEASGAEGVMHAQMSVAMENLAPAFSQLHGASDTFLDILADYGVNHHGHFSGGLNMITRNGGDNSISGTSAADGINAGDGDDRINGRGGADILQGGYGNDRIQGGGGRDVLDGGHGEDTLVGGSGSDLLISRADGREGAIFYDPDRDEGDPYNELINGQVHPDQPIPGDDVLIGGRGADIFYFQTLINAKERFIREHTREDGTINWHGVAGENDNLHDHWVDILGHDVVQDYSRAEGDRIVIEGHTTEIASITYGDANGDGVMDHSVISLYSDQGRNGGAHNDDRLGTITVYGDLVRLSDIEHTAAPAYGIIRTIDDLEEALAPSDYGTDSGPIAAPNTGRLHAADFNYLTTFSPVFGMSGSHEFFAGDRASYIFDHTGDLALSSGTVAFRFSANSLSGYQTLFSKDASGNGNGGHLTVYLDQTGMLVVRFQDAEDSHYFVTRNAVEVGKDYDFALSFGDAGLEVYLNGARIASDQTLQLDWDQNSEALIVGASGSSNSPGEADEVHSYFDGTISDFAIFDQQLTSEDLYGSAPRSDYAYFDGRIDNFEFSRGTGGSVAITRGDDTTELWAETTFASFNGVTVRTADIQIGSRAVDELRGGDGADVLAGLGSDDRILGMGNDDFLLGGNGNDTLYGGAGRDTLHGQRGDDKLAGSDGRDVLRGGDGHDTLYGEAGNDRFFGGYGDDLILGNTWDEAGSATADQVYYDGNFADFSIEIETRFDSHRGEDVTWLTITDSASGGADGYYEGSDRLVDIDVLIFADQTVLVSDLL